MQCLFFCTLTAGFSALLWKYTPSAWCREEPALKLPKTEPPLDQKDLRLFALLQLPCLWALIQGRSPAEAALLLAEGVLCFQLFLCDGLFYLLQDQWTLLLAILGAGARLCKAFPGGLTALLGPLLAAEAVLLLWLAAALPAAFLNAPLPFGLGDAKLMAAGALLLSESFFSALLAASLMAGLWSAGILICAALQKTEKRDRIAFGPFLVIGFLLYL